MEKHKYKEDWKLTWHDYKTDPPKKTGTDQNLLLKVGGGDCPFMYVAVVFDGENFWHLATDYKAPWTYLPSWVKIEEWSEID